MKKIIDRLRFIFEDEAKIKRLAERIEKVIAEFKERNSFEKSEQWISEKDAYLITYGDSLKEEGVAPLQTLNKFAKKYLGENINNIHILPFYPWTSDDGFSVVDYWEIDENLGDWNDVKELSKNFKMMYDAVVNHISASSDWFKGYLAGDEKYQGFFIEKEWCDDIKNITRPRTHPVLTEFDTVNGKKNIWTTFSTDQIDINMENEDVFMKIIELLLFYVEQGSVSIRLDAIGYMWKELGTSCIHHPKAHEIIKLWRDMFDIAAPDTILISETNVPHKDNISYFGNGHDEVRMVYQFSLPPLTVHTLQTGDAIALTKWAASLEKISDETTFFNFLSSHDGIGVVPATGLLTKEEIDGMIDRVKSYGGKVSYKTNSDGSQSPYEMNINYLESLSHPDEETEIRVKKFISAQVILLAMRGVPAIYIHSLLGSLNDFEGLKATGRNRSINREKLDYSKIIDELEDKNSRRAKVFYSIVELLKVRKEKKAFNPLGDQKTLDVDKNIFAVERSYKDEKVLIINNISSEAKKISVDSDNSLICLLSGKEYLVENTKVEIELKPYEYLWLEEKK